MPSTKPSSCPGCGASSTRFVFTKSGHAHYRCRACTLLYVYPVPSAEQLEAMYRARDFAKGTGQNLCWDASRSHMHTTWARMLRRMETWTERGPLLDVGCGTGQFLSFARAQGWQELTGMEVSPEAAALASERSGVPVHAGTLDDAPFNAGAFKAITLWDVVEHLDDVPALLRQVSRLMCPGAVVAISTCNTRGLSIRLLRRHALSFMPPEHLVFFNARSLKPVLAAAGLTLRWHTSIDVFLREWSRFIPARAAKPQAKEEASYARSYDLVTGSQICRAAREVANALLGVADLGDELIAIAQKTETAT